MYLYNTVKLTFKRLSQPSVKIHVTEYGLQKIPVNLIDFSSKF